LYAPTIARRVPIKMNAGTASRLRTIRKLAYFKTEPPNALPTSWRCPGQHKRVVGGSFTPNLNSLSVMAATAQAMSPKCGLKGQQKTPANVFDAGFDSAVKDSASCQQKHIPLFRVPFEKGVKFIPASNGLRQINKSAHRPNIGFPFLAARFIEKVSKRCQSMVLSYFSSVLINSIPFFSF